MTAHIMAGAASCFRPAGTPPRAFKGWDMAGRPTPDELRIALREMSRRVREDFDFEGD